MSTQEINYQLYNEYTQIEQKWNLLEKEDDKKYMAWQTLRWCKRVRDLYDSDEEEEEEEEPNSVIDLVKYIDINKHIDIWVGHVAIWRVRFNITHSI